MRCLIIYLVLALLDFSPTVGREINQTADIHQVVYKSEQRIQKPSTFFKTQGHSLHQEPLSTYIHQLVSTPHPPVFAVVMNTLNDRYNLGLLPVLLAKHFIGSNTYRYQFIFNCLYPKHTFW